MDLSEVKKFEVLTATIKEFNFTWDVPARTPQNLPKDRAERAASLRKIADVLDAPTVHGLEVRQITGSLFGNLHASKAIFACAVGKLYFYIYGGHVINQHLCSVTDLFRAFPGTVEEDYKGIVSRNDHFRMSFHFIAKELREQAASIEERLQAERVSKLDKGGHVGDRVRNRDPYFRIPVPTLATLATDPLEPVAIEPAKHYYLDKEGAKVFEYA